MVVRGLKLSERQGVSVLALYFDVGDAVCLHAVDFLLVLHEMAGVRHYLASMRYGLAAAPASDVLGVEAITYRAQAQSLHAATCL